MAKAMIDEFTDKEGHDPEKMIEYLSYVLKNSLPSVLSGATAK